MKHTHYLPLAISALLSLGSVGQSQVTYESFENYTVGSKLHTANVGLNHGENWSGPWNIVNSGRKNEYTITSGGLTYSAGGLNIDGGDRALQYVATEGGNLVVGGRPFTSTTGTTYMSFLYNNTVDTGGNDDFTQIGLDSSITNPRTSAIDRNTFQARRGTSATDDSGIPSVTGQTYLLVAKIEKNASTNYNAVSLFVDPTSTTEPGTPDAMVTGDSGTSSLANLVFRKAFPESGDTFVFDEFRIGSSFADVTESLSAASSVPTDIVFQDDFDLDPGTAGALGRTGTGSSSAWTESVTDTGSVDGDIISTGTGLAQFQTDGLNVDGNDFDTFSITRTIDATNFTNLFVDLSALDDADNVLEGDDTLDILIDTGTGFNSIFSLEGDFNEDATQGSLITSPLALSSDADMSMFDLRIEGVSNVEDFFFDQITVFGQAQAVPEPSAVALWCLLGFALVGGRSLRRAMRTPRQ